MTISTDDIYFHNQYLVILDLKNRQLHLFVNIFEQDSIIAERIK